MVGHAVVDWGTSHLFDAANRVARSWEFPRRTLGVLFLFLGHQHVRGVEGHRDDQVSRGDWRSLHADCRASAACMDYAEGRRLWSGAAYGEQVSLDEGVHSIFYPRADGHGRILVHGGFKHSGFHALRKIAESANGGAGAGASNGYDALRVNRGGGQFRSGGAVRCADLGSCRAAWQI